MRLNGKPSKLCSRCGKQKPLSDFDPRPSTHSYRSWCHRCEADRRVLYRRELKSKVLEHYGTTCACCGEKEVSFLTIDHIYGGGQLHRKLLVRGRGGEEFYRFLVKKRFPPGYQVLCFNCNFARSMYGRCPHQKPPNGDDSVIA